MRQLVCSFREQLGKVVGDRRELEPGFAGEVGDAEAAAEVQKAHWRGSGVGQAQGELEALPLSLDDGLGLEVLRTRENMKSFEVQPQALDLRQQLGHLLSIDAKRLWPAAHLHRRAAQLEIRIHPHGHPGRQSQRL